jgi:hemoglobin
MEKRRSEDASHASSSGLSGTRRDVLEGAMLLPAAALAGVLAVEPAHAAEQGSTRKQPAAGQSLYDRLGGIFAIAAVVNHFSDAIIQDPIAGARSRNPALREWHTRQLGRLPGLKFMRTLWVANAAGGPYHFTPTRPGSTPLGLENAHRNLRISPREFDAVARVLSRSLDRFNVPRREKAEVLAAFAAHKDEVTLGFRQGAGSRR